MTKISKKQQTHQKRNLYYGGDVFHEDDEESKKLYLNDCRRRQAALYPIYSFASPFVRSILHPPSHGELLVLSGQSRLHIHLETKQTTTQLRSGPKDPLVLFDESDTFPEFPATLEEEANAFRSHGFPLLVWPGTKSVDEIQQFLQTHYPDCALWFGEYHKVITWLDRKWRPLARSVGIKINDMLAEVWLEQLPPDSVAATYIRQRLLDYEEFASLLRAYFVHRRRWSPGFQFHHIHTKLSNLYEARKAALSEDSGFFNVVGNRLLRLAAEAQANSLPVRLNAKALALSIEDPIMRRQCLQTLLSVKALKRLKDRKTPKRRTSEESPIGFDERKAKLQKLSESEESMDEPDSLPSANPTKVYPNRPVTKDILENRGLVKYRHKRERNPRVHLRHKYRKATIRYRSRVPPARFEDKPYVGETKGIRVHLVRSHKFKTS